MSDKNQLPEKKEVTYLRRKILDWYKDNGREFPWRETDDPYRLLIAEMMLQKTPADRVQEVYMDFFAKYPRIEDVAEAREEDLYDILSPLGLKKRFDNFKQISNEIPQNHEERVPRNRAGLRQLTGVGEYIAGIVCSVAFKQKEWILDSNVIRIFGRFFGLTAREEKYDDPRFIEIAKKYARTSKPRQSNLGLIDFGALVCQSNEPDFSNCPVKSKCDEYSSRSR